MSLAPSPCTRSSSRRPGAVALRGHRVEVAGEQHERPVAARGRAGEHAGVAGVARAPPARSTPARARPARPRRATPRDVDELERPRGEALGEVVGRITTPDLSLAGPMRYCGIDVSAKPGQPAARARCTSAAARDGRRARRDVLRARRRRAVARTVLGFGGEAVVGDRRAVRAGGWTCWPPGRRCATRSACPTGRYERIARLRRAAVPPRAAAVPGARPPSRRWRAGRLDGRSASTLFAALDALGLFRPAAPAAAASRARSATARCASGACARPTPTPSSARCSATARRRSARRGACSSGSRRCACAASSTTTAGSGTARSTSSTRAPRPTPPTRWPTGSACWVGDPREGVIVLPGAGLLERYEKLRPSSAERRVGAAGSPARAPTVTSARP